MLKRGILEIIEEGEFERLISSKRALNIKFGVDPTAPDIHLGHLVLLRKLKCFQELGHNIIFIIGDFTAKIGDPSGRDKTRPSLLEDVIKENAKTYIEQVFKILSFKKTKILYNSSWFDKMSLSEFIPLSFSYTVSRMLERDDFTLRYKNRKPIAIAEFLYPLLQGYDSYIVKADIEIGGSDQKFNMLVGREIQRFYSLNPQIVITTPLLEGTDGKLKMSKSYNNYIGIKESPKEIFGKVMSIPDAPMIKYYELLTDENYLKIKDEIEKGKLHPMKAKEELAFLITSFCHSKDKAKDAREEFRTVFSQKEIPDEILEYKIDKPSLIVDIIFKSGLSNSKSQARRLILQGGVKICEKKIEDPDFQLEIPEEAIILKVGKRRFLKVVK
ncbi:MAG: tyrosine--tRNA ligase [bacterium]